MIQENSIKPKAKIGLSSFLDLLTKWRNDLKIKNMGHIKLLQTILDESGYSAMLKNKKDLENENRLENLKELLRAMQDYDSLQNFLEHVALATSIDQEWEGAKINLMTRNLIFLNKNTEKIIDKTNFDFVVVTYRTKVK